MPWFLNRCQSGLPLFPSLPLLQVTESKALLSGTASCVNVWNCEQIRICIQHL
jgi:hypothetical protein